jgi:hypothetical protein
MLQVTALSGGSDRRAFTVGLDNQPAREFRRGPYPTKITVRKELSSPDVIAKK